MGCFAPFDQRVFPEGRVAGDEVERGLAELVAEFVEAIGQTDEPGIRDEASDATEKREACAFDHGVSTRFDEREGRECFAWDEALVTELDEPVTHGGRVEPEVFGLEAFAPAPVTDAGVAEHSPAAHGFEEWEVVLILVHVFWLFGLLFAGK